MEENCKIHIDGELRRRKCEVCRSSLEVLEDSIKVAYIFDFFELFLSLKHHGLHDKLLQDGIEGVPILKIFLVVCLDHLVKNT